MVTQTRPTPTETQTPVRKSQLGPIAPERASVQVVELPARFRTPAPQPAAAKNRSLTAKIGHRLMAFYDWLSGPPTNEMERTRAKLADAVNVTRAYRGF